MPTSAETRAERAQEARLRRLAQRQDLLLRRSRCRTPEAVGYGQYFVIDPHINGLVSSAYGMNLDQVEAFLTDDS